MRKLILGSLIIMCAAGYTSAQVGWDSTSNVVAPPPFPPRKFNHIFKFGPLHLLANRFNIGYEYFLPKHKVSLYISPSLYITQNTDLNASVYSSNTNKTYGYILDFQVRIYLGDTDFKNPRARFNHLYLAPYGNLAYYRMDGEGTVSTYSTGFNSSSIVSYSNSVSAYGGGFAVGYQLFLFKNRVTLDGYFGGGLRFSYQANNNSLNSNNSNYNYLLPASSLFDNGSAVYSINYTGVVPRIGFQIGYVF